MATSVTVAAIIMTVVEVSMDLLRMTRKSYRDDIACFGEVRIWPISLNRVYRISKAGTVTALNDLNVLNCLNQLRLDDERRLLLCLAFLLRKIDGKTPLHETGKKSDIQRSRISLRDLLRYRHREVGHLRTAGLNEVKSHILHSPLQDLPCLPRAERLYRIAHDGGHAFFFLYGIEHQAAGLCFLKLSEKMLHPIRI